MKLNVFIFLYHKLNLKESLEIDRRNFVQNLSKKSMNNLLKFPGHLRIIYDSKNLISIHLNDEKRGFKNNINRSNNRSNKESYVASATQQKRMKPDRGDFPI